MTHASVQQAPREPGPGEVESVHPLSPVQEGMRFHTLLDAASGVYVQQLVLLLEGADAELLGRSWQQAVDHHAVLRGSVRGEGLDGPRLVVPPRVMLPVRVEDWRGQSEAERRGRLDAYLLSDRQRGFELEAGPLVRLLIARTAEESLALVWSHHHLLLDEASLLLVLRDVFAIHEALRQGGEARLEHPRPHRDYVEWLLGREHSEAEAFWRKQLQGFSAPTPLVVDRPRSLEAREPRAGERTLGLGAGLSEALRSMSARHGLKLDTLAEGAWAVLLSRYSSEQDVVFGRVADDREALPGARSMVGPCFQLVPRRVQVPAEEAVLPWLQRLEAQEEELRRHARLPLVRVRALSQVERGKPLFETVFISQGDLHQEVARCLGAGLRLHEARLVEHTNHALTALLSVGPELSLSLRYDAARFDEATISRMLGHWEALLEGMARAPEQGLASLQLLTAAERQHLLVEVNQGKAFPQDKCIHELFQLQAGRFPDAVAVSLGEAVLTYRELERRSNLVAHHLQGLGVGPGVLVGLYLERSLELIVGMLGILKAGGAYLPLDSTVPMERIGFILQDARVPVVLTDSVLAGRLPASDVKVTCLDTDWSTLATGREDCPTSGATPGTLAYVIYTSGSTGQPKGVMVNHEHVGRLFAATDAWFRFNERDVWTFFHSSAFDFSVWEIWGALLHGGRLVVVPYLVSRSPDDFHELLCREQVTVLNQTPSAFRQLSQADQSRGAQARLALRYVIFGGEALELESLRPWFEKHGGERPQLINMYGITETTVHVTYRPIVKDDLALRSSVIGRPIPDLQLYLLDPHGNPVPVGVPGEIHVGGAGVARGYLARPELSAARFIPDRFSGAPEARLYRSGDLARFRANGDIEYLGRIDHQVKIRGFRIELGEIEAALQQHPGVGEAVVLVREDVPGDKRLVAYVVPRTPAAPSTGELRSALLEKLPDYMVPTAFVTLDVLPLTANGKVDRRALPAPRKSAGSTPAPEAPRSDTEQMLAALWADLLGVEEVGSQDDFFALGGNSLSALLLAARLQALLGVECDVKSIFLAPTLARLAASVMPAHPAQGAPASEQRASSSQVGASQTSSESTAATLKKLWEELLQVEGISDQDDFFVLGGHSTILVEALYRIETLLGVKLGFREFFQNPTISQLAALLEQRSAKEDEPQYVFDMQVGTDVATFHLSEEDYRRDGIPEGAFNVRVIRGSN